MTSFKNTIRDQGGATALFVALSITMVFGAAAMAVDLGMLATARAEAQNAADGAALAAAAALAYGQNVDDDARRYAVEFAARNAVRNQSVTLDASDVTIVGDTVRVAVVRAGSRDNAVPTVFARVLGTRSVDISASATAAPIQGPAEIACMLPITIPDRWVNRGSQRWNRSERDYYPRLFRRDGTYNPRYQGYAQPGERLVLHPQLPRFRFRRNPNLMEPEHSFVWLPGRLRRHRDVRARVDGCPDGADAGSEQGDWLRWSNLTFDHWQIAEGLRTVMRDSRYSGQYYDSQCQCVRDRNDGDELVTGGPRYRAIPVFNPATFRPLSYERNFQVTHFVGVFIERVTGSRTNPRITVRILPLVGTGTANNHAGPLVRVVRLVG